MPGVGKDPTVATILSVVPGLGHVYCGRIGAGAAWLVVAWISYSINPVFGLVVHGFCALSARASALRSTEQDRANLRSRRESAAEVARAIDAAAGAVPPVAARVEDPPPRHLRAAFPVPPHVLVGALADAFSASGLVVLGVDPDRGVVRASEALDGSLAAEVKAEVEATPMGSRVRFTIDRPPGAVEDERADDERLRALLENTERRLGLVQAAPDSPPAESAPPPPRPGAPVTEDVFLSRLREMWEAREEGRLPEDEWVRQKHGLMRALVLRSGTRSGDFLSACRPLHEAGVLTDEDLHEVETAVRK